MLQLTNNTPFVAGFQVFPNANGIDTLFLVVKATFTMGANLTLAEQQLPIHLVDEYLGEPGASSLKAVSEAHVGKAATDVLLFGLACSPGLKPVKAMDIGIDIAGRQKLARVYGNRVWRNGVLSEPEPFANMPVVWERAYGGKRVSGSSRQDVFSENPLGIGFGEPEENSLAPNIEPFSPANSARNQAVGFGPVCPSWPNRVQYAGTYDERWQRERAPYLPQDFNARFLNSAPADQIFPGFMLGGEAIRLVGFHPDGELAFNVPRVNLMGKAQIGSQSQEASFDLETLAIYPNQKQFSLTWRGALACPRGPASVKYVTISLSR